MLPKSTVRPLVLAKVHNCSRSILRKFSDQSVAVDVKKGTNLKVDKKPCRPPFMKNVFLGIFDQEMLVYPEFDKTRLKELKAKIQPYQDFFKNNVDPKVLSSLKIIPSEIKENFKNLGLFGQIIPVEYGGCGQTAVESTYISEIVAKDIDVALMLYSHNFLGAQTVVSFGSKEQKERYLPKLASGELISAVCISESNSGSDLASIKSETVKSEDDPNIYILNGRKKWVINGSNAGLLVVLAKCGSVVVSRKEVPQFRVMLVDKESPGVTVTETLDHVGLNASGICEIQFKDTPVDVKNFVGDELTSFEICAEILNSGRHNLGAMTVSVLKKLLKMACDFTVSRTQYDKNLVDCELIQEKVSEISTCIYALESMTYLTALIMDIYDNPDCSVELAIIKVFSFTEGRRCLDLLMELMGGRAFLTSEIIQKYFRDFRTMEVFDGTTDIANLYISLISLQHASIAMKDIVSKMRNPYDFPGFIFKRAFSHRRQASDNPKLTLKLFEKLHPSLMDAANELEYCVLRLEYAVTVFFTSYGTDVHKQQLDLERLADTAVKIFAMTAVLGRASRSYCIGLPNSETEVKYAMTICSKYKKIVQNQLNDVIHKLAVKGDAFILKFGPDIFKHHGYFVEHPLERTF